MATLRQKAVANAIVKNLQEGKVKPAKEVLESVGYGTGLQNSPQRVLNSEGVQKELKILGFDEDTAKEVVADLLVDSTVEPRDRLKAAEMVFKVHGTFAPVKTANLNANMDLSTDDTAVDLDLLVKEAESKLKEQKLNGTGE